jgi:hypothetical protein
MMLKTKLGSVSVKGDLEVNDRFGSEYSRNHEEKRNMASGMINSIYKTKVGSKKQHNNT